MMEVMQLLTQMSMALNNNNLTINNLNNNINDINNTMNNNMNNLRAEINSNSDATRAELLERIDQRSRLSSDVAETPRADSLAPVLPPPKTRMNQVNESKSGTNIPDIAETPHANSFGPDLTLTQVFRNKDAADRFEEENIVEAVYLRSPTGTTPMPTVTHLMPRIGPTIQCIVNSSRGRLQYAKQSRTVLLPSRSVSPSRKTSWTSRTSSMSKSDSPHTCPMTSRRK